MYPRATSDSRSSATDPAPPVAAAGRSDAAVAPLPAGESAVIGRKRGRRRECPTDPAAPDPPPAYCAARSAARASARPAYTPARCTRNSPEA